MKGLKEVRGIISNDKRRLTVLPTVSLNGNLLPLFVIMKTLPAGLRKI